MPVRYDKSKALDAFRSITGMVSKIRKAQFSTSPDIRSNNTAEGGHSKLMPLVAFSILAALEHEVVAVGAMPAVSNSFTSLVFTGNYRWSDAAKINSAMESITAGSVAPTSERPHIIPTSPPTGLQPNSTTDELQSYVDKLFEDKLTNASYSSKFEPHLHFSLPGHLDALRQLISTGSDDKEASKRLQGYAVATLYAKMESRMGKVSSTAYIDALHAVPIENLDPTMAQLPAGPGRKDRSFLIWLSYLPDDWRRAFPELHKLGTSFREAEAPTPVPERFQFRSGEARKQFHSLFIICLMGFAESLRKLVEIRGPSGGNTSDNFRFHGTAVRRYGDCLRRIARTQALQMHLLAIHSAIPMPTLGDSLPVCGEEDERHPVCGEEDGRHPDCGEEGERHPDCGEEDEHHPDGGEEDELQDVEPLSTDAEVLVTNSDMLRLRPYRDWFRLIVAEFDAADALLRQFTDNHLQDSPISIQVVTPLSSSQATLPWKDLFLSSLYIPDAPEGKNNITNAQLFQFLTNLDLAVPRAAMWLNKLGNHWSNRQKREMGEMIEAQELLKLYQKQPQSHNCWQSWLEAPKPSRPLVLMPDWLPNLDILASLLKTQEREPISDVDANIQNTLKLLKDSFLFFKTIAASKNGDFKGRIHCEACLVSLIAASATKDIDEDDDYKTVLAVTKDLGHTIAVSKRCCPTCSALIGLLVHKDGAFLTRGSHNNISPCSLPTWLPDDIVAKMNDKFGLMLRNELIAVIKAPEPRRMRADSTGSSGRSSSDGEEGEGDERVEPDYSGEGKSMPLMKT